MGCRGATVWNALPPRPERGNRRRYVRGRGLLYRNRKGKHGGITMNMADILMTLEEVAACVRARTPGEAKGWLKRAGVRPVPFGGKLGTRYMRQDVLEAIEAAKGIKTENNTPLHRRPPLSKRAISGRSRRELIAELSGPQKPIMQ